MILIININKALNGIYNKLWFYFKLSIFIFLFSYTSFFKIGNCVNSGQQVQDRRSQLKQTALIDPNIQNTPNLTSNQQQVQTQATNFSKEKTSNEIKLKNQPINQKQFFQQIKQLILSTPHLCLVLEKEFFHFLFRDCEKQYWSAEARELLIKQLFFYIKFSLDSLKPSFLTEKQNTIDNFAEKFGKQLYMVVNQNKLKNYWIVKSLSYIDKFKQSWFLFSDESGIEKMTEDIRNLCINNTTSVIFLSSYFVKCCREEQTNNVPISNINHTLGKVANKLKEMFSPKSKLEQEMKYNKRSFEESELKRLASSQFPFKPKELVFSGQNKEVQLEDLIMSIVQQGKKHYSNFTQLTSSCCLTSEGFSYKSNLKLKDRSQEMPMLRVKEKLLKKNIQQFYKQKSYSCNSIDELEKQQVAYLQSVLKEIYEKMDRIQFTVSDILRGKCMFNKIAHINTAAEKIINRVKDRAQKGEDIQIVQIDNRLAKITTDLVLKIRIEEIVCQFQLALKFNQAENEIHHKMYQIERSKMFSPVSMLFRWHRQLSNEYFGIVDKILRESSINNKIQLIQKVDQLKKMVGFIDPQKIHKKTGLFSQNEHKIYLEYKNMVFQPILNPSLSKLAPLRSGIVLKEMKKYKEAQQFLIKSNIDELKNEQLIYNLGDIFRLRGSFNKALKYYQKFSDNCSLPQKKSKRYQKCVRYQAECLWEINKGTQAYQTLKKLFDFQQKQFGYENLQCIETLSYIGKALSKLGKFVQSLQMFEKVLKLYQSVKNGIEQSNYPEAFKNIGQVYIQLKNLSRSLQYLNKSISLSEKINGKQSYETTQIYLTFGRVYQQMGKYKQAQQHYQKYLLMVQNTMGQDNFYYATGLIILGSLYQLQGKLDICYSHLRISQNLILGISGQNSSQYMYIKNSLGLYYFTTGDLQKAKKEFETCISILFSMGDHENPNIAVLYGNLAVAQQNLKNFQSAEKYYGMQMELIKKVFGPQSVNYAFLLHNIAVFYFQTSKIDEAAKLFSQCLSLYERNSVQNSQDYRDVLSNAGFFYNKTLDKAKAKICLEKANRMIEATLGISNPRYILNKQILDSLDQQQLDKVSQKLI